MPDIGDGPFVQLRNDFICAKWLSMGAKVVYAILRSYVGANLDKPAFPGQGRLAEETRSDEKTVRALIRELEMHGFVYPVRRGLGKTNYYYLDIQEGKAEGLSAEMVALSRKKTAAAFEKIRFSAERFRDCRDNQQQDCTGAVKVAYRDITAMICSGNSESTITTVAVLKNVSSSYFIERLVTDGFNQNEIYAIAVFLERGHLSIKKDAVRAMQKRLSAERITEWVRSFGDCTNLAACLPEHTPEEVAQIWQYYHRA